MAGKEGNGVVRAPEGMMRVGSVANAPWFNLAKGNIIHGKLLNVFERPDERAKSGRSKFFQVEALEPCDVRIGRGKEAKVGKAKAGDVVNLNHGPATKDLEKFIPDIRRGAQYNVWAHVEGEKFAIKNGQTMWPIDVRAELTRPMPSADNPDFGGSGDEATE
jgi:hypothetical protein